jgi:hypothetical protein
MKPKITRISLAIYACMCFLIGVPNDSIGQVGVNTTTPNGILDINSTNMGVVLPRLALTSTIVMAPATNPQGGNIPIGTVVFNTSTTTSGTNDVVPGMYSWDGTQWRPQFPKRQYALYESAIGLKSVPGTTRTVQLNGNNSNTFTAKYTGQYKVKVRVDFGGGNARTPNEGSGAGTSDGDLNIANATGTYTLNFGGTNYTIPVYSYSTAYNAVTPATNYFAIWQEFTGTEYVSLKANDNVAFTLTFLQDTAEEYVTGSGGYGNISYDIPCYVEISYLGE